jgi:pyocin large subunit-like protein
MGGRSVEGGGWVCKGFSPASLNYHWQEHGKQFPNIKTKEGYNAKAKKLLDSKIGGHIEGFTAKDGRVYRYEKSANILAIGNPDGSIKTYFRPDTTTYYYKEKRIWKK